MNPIQDYLRRIEKALTAGNATEHTYRPALKTLIESINNDITATNEPRREQYGAPDYIVSRAAAPIGYIEAKDIGKPLDVIEREEQLKRYRQGLHNLILTDYLEFRWYVWGEHRLTARLARVAENGRLKAAKNGAEEVAALLHEFLHSRVAVINNPRELAVRMAALARLLRAMILEIFAVENSVGTLHAQMEGFRRVLLHDLTKEQFADMYAQTIAYGLFAARCNTKTDGHFIREQAAYDLPKTNPFLRRMFSNIAGPDLHEQLIWIVNDLTSILERTDIAAILKDFGRSTRREDPVVHFYETFLAAYDSKMREARGVYYTPEPVVSYIVRSVDHILKTDFGLKDGLADAAKIMVKDSDGKTGKEIHRVLILDPATGTGTFLHQVIHQIHDTLCANGQQGAWGGKNGYVARHLLPRLFGFELLMAPYAVAHMKLGLLLDQTGYDFGVDERLRIYLTNTLEEAFKMGDLPLFARWLAEEVNAAGEVKKNFPVMVILGNPPYSGHSANTGPWISSLLRGENIQTGKKTDNYFEADGKPLGEKNPKWLNDDYVKFIRFAQWRVEQTGYGVLAFVTNHGYLDNPTFRGMRQSLMKTFDDIYVLDLHGNSKKKEKCPDGSKDENVFDIQQGVAIGMFVKRAGKKEETAIVRHADLWGVRSIYAQNTQEEQRLTGGKYAWLWEQDVAATPWKPLTPRSPYYLFIPQDMDLREEYERGWKITDIFPVNSVGIVTARDALTIGWTREEIWERVRKFVALSEEDARTAFKLGKDAQDWIINLAQQDVKKSGPDSDKITPILYRPFDTRFTYYTGQSRGFICRPRPEVMGHMIQKNKGLILPKRVESAGPWRHVLCTDHMIEHVTVSLKTIDYLFPLHLDTSKQHAPSDTHNWLTDNHGRIPNLSPAFIKELEKALGLSFDPSGSVGKVFTSEDIFHYIYAILHSPDYRSRYAEFLKIDFPRLPLTSDAGLFRSLCELGRELVALHLLETHPVAETRFPIAGDSAVEAVRYTEPGQGSAAGRVWIDKTQYFEGVPPEVWAFHVGGYQVCQKWLKDRKGRQLTYNDITHYQRIVAALKETIRLMAEIDRIIDTHGGWPLK